MNRMKLISKISKTLQAVSIPCCLLTSCNYLDVVPLETADFEDTMQDESAVLNFLYTCYGYVPRCQPYDFKAYEQSADEIVSPVQWDDYQQQLAWGTLSPSYYEEWSSGQTSDDFSIWIPSYNWLGYVNRFLDLIDELQPTGVTDEDKEQYKAECYFLQAYYQFRVLAAMGPCPIIPALVDPNITSDELPGRSHFDYCVDYIVDKLDQAAAVLPATRETQYLGRATSTIALALKARVLLYAASPLWNGSFYDNSWANTNYETEGYGYELVSHTYDRSKWERALTANQEALNAALNAGHVLFSVETANAKATRDDLDLPFVPGKEEDTDENNEFKELVRMFQYLVTTTEGDNNDEIIWGQRIDSDYNNGGEATTCRLPNRCLYTSSGTWTGGWAGLAPTLYTVQHFYTENGLLPEDDPDFPDESEWYTRFYEGVSSPDPVTSGLDTEEVKNDIIKLNGNREARFYAWIAFDGCQYAQKITNGSPLWLNFKNTNTNGYRSADARNIAGTGFLSRKFVDPNITFSSTGSQTSNATRRPYIRLAELYLNLAECHAALGNTSEALGNLNIIRGRAGLPDLTESDLGIMSLEEWVHAERYIELFEEGHRYYDLRRWCIASDMLKAGTRYGLNGLVLNPTFEEFNTPVLIDQPFKWYDRYYLLPIWSRSDLDELYSNPQLVQAPGY